MEGQEMKEQKNMIQLFEDIEKQFPQKTALRDSNGAWNFAELGQKARQRARELSKVLEEEAVSRQVPVGIVAFHTKETIAELLAVMYSGNFFVTFAEDTPKQRREMIFENSGLEFYYDGGILRKKTGEPVKTIESEEIGEPENTLLRGYQCTDEDTLYLVYTSGSTGVPKGVQKSWGAMKAFAEQYQKTFSLSEQEILGNQTPFYFDAAMKDVFQMLTTGAELNIIPDRLFSFPIKLVEYLNEHKITMIVWVPSALKIVSVLNTFLAVQPKTLQKVLFVGEVLDSKHLANWMEQLPEAMFVNLYGSSEVAGVCSYYIVKQKPEPGAVLPLGQGFEADEVALISEAGERIFPVPENESAQGELCVFGKTLADGYFHDEDRTREAFSDNPFPEISSKKMFHTGDLGRYDTEGNLVYCGRKDFQIKHMGYRIELEEIELAVREIPEIVSNACIFDAKKDKIILFYQKKSKEPLTKKDIIAKLIDRLPEYMLPNKVVETEEIPLSPNGKTDRMRLMEQYRNR